MASIGIIYLRWEKSIYSYLKQEDASATMLDTKTRHTMSLQIGLIFLADAVTWSTVTTLKGGNGLRRENQLLAWLVCGTLLAFILPLTIM